MELKTKSMKQKARNIKLSIVINALCIVLLICTSQPTHSIHYTSIAKKDSKKEKEKDKDKEKKKKKKPINKAEFQPVLVGTLLTNPSEFLNKKIKFRGKFSSFTTLALDYKPALRESKKFISLCIFRTDSHVPLSELKLAYPVEEAKDNQVIRELEEGDIIEIYGKVFSAALDEPWVDILHITKIASGEKKKAEDKDKKSENKKDKEKNEKKNKKE